MSYEQSLEHAKDLDRKDPLSSFRSHFHVPTQANGEEHIYLCGNSLGLQPVRTKEYIQQELDAWAAHGVEGHVTGKTPWLPYHEFLTEQMAKIVGAKPIETVVMNTLTVNLHLLMVSFYRPTATRYKILIEGDAFPSDRYAVDSQARFHGHDPQDAIITWNNPDGVLPDYDALERILNEEGNSIALVMIGAVNYYTGQLFDLKRIADLAHNHGAMVGFDCAHAAGNVPLQLHDSGADFACWCTYKYLNSGPGSLSGAFVHERHATTDLPRFEGWWGHNKDTRFKMRDDFDPIPGAEAWQLSNPPILSMAAIRASLDVFAEAGFENLVTKSKKLTAYLEGLLSQMDSDNVRIITPTDPEQRGCQLSIAVAGGNRGLFDKITAAGVIADWREPDVIRIAPVPLYNSYEDCWKFVDVLKNCLAS